MKLVTALHTNYSVAQQITWVAINSEQVVAVFKRTVETHAFERKSCQKEISHHKPRYKMIL
jgi:hypothetical protein